MVLCLATTAACAQGTPRIPNVFVVGNTPASVERGFDPTKIHVIQSVATDETTRGYLHSGAWDKLLTEVHSGDFVLLDFNGNASPAAVRSDATRTLDGFGDGTFDYLDPGTGKLELVHSYGWYLRKMVVDVINQGGTPLMCAAPPNPAAPGAGDWARYIATEQRIPLVSVAADGSGVIAGLRATKPDPLEPYLAGKASGGS